MASIRGLRLPFPHNRDRPEMSPQEEEEKRKRNLKLRAELIRRKLELRERVAKDAGREFNRDDHKITGYDWLLIPPRELQDCHMLNPREGSHAAASDPTKATTSRKEARE